MLKYRCMRKSQTSTEYLVILTVVIVVALVLVNTMGGFPGIGSNSGKKVSDMKLASDTIGIESYSIGNTSSLFKIKNNYFDTVTVTEFRVNQNSNLTCNSSNTIPALPLVLNIGESKLVNCSAVNSSNYVITNKQTPIVGISYTDALGATRTAGNAVNNGNVNSGNVSQGGSQPYVPSSTVLSLRNGLVAYYPLDGNVSDLSGNSNDGTNNGASYTQSGKVGGAYSFDGVNDNVVTSSVSHNIGTANFAYSAWINPLAYSGSPTGSSIVANGNYDPLLIINGNNLQIYSASAGGIFDFGCTVNLNEWSFVVMSRSSGLVKGYVNGVLCPNEPNIEYYFSDAQQIIGRSGVDFDGDYFTGKLDEVSIWNRALNSTEISNLYNNETGLSLSLSGPLAPACQAGVTNCSGTNYLTCTDGNWVNNGNVDGQCAYAPPGDINVLRNGLVAYFPLDGNVSDESGNSNDGTNNGAIYTSSGKVGGGYSFSSSTVWPGTNNIPSGSASRSYGFWFKFNSIPGSDIQLLGWGSQNDERGQRWNAGFSPSAGLYVENILEITNVYWTPDYNWHYFFATLDGPTQSYTKIYLDGVLQDVIHTSPDLTINTNEVTYFGSFVNWLYFFDGDMDEVAIWNRALNSTEVAQLYNNATGFSLSLGGAQAPICLVGQTDCNDTNYLVCTSGDWVNNGDVIGHCGVVDQGLDVPFLDTNFHYMVFSDYDNYLVKFYDTTNDRLAKSITVPYKTGTFAVDRNSNVWAISEGNHIIRINSTFSIDRDFTTGGNELAGGIVIDRDGNIWVNNHGYSGGDVSIRKLNGTTGTVMLTVNGGGSKRQMSMDFNGNIVAVNSEWGGTIVKINYTTGAVMFTGTVPSYIGYSATGLHKIAIDNSNNIWVGGFYSNSFYKFLSAGTYVGTWVSGLGRLTPCGIELPGSIWVGSDNTIWVINYASYYLSHYYNNGTLISNTLYGGYPSEISMDKNDNIWLAVCGNSQPAFSGIPCYDGYILKISSTTGQVLDNITGYTNIQGFGSDNTRQKYDKVING